MNGQNLETMYLETVTYIEESKEVILEFVSDLKTRKKYLTITFGDVSEYKRQRAQKPVSQKPYKSLRIIQGGGPSADWTHHLFIEHDRDEITFFSPANPASKYH